MLSYSLGVYLNQYCILGVQWFGVDIGGTLVKCVYFETQEEDEDGKTEACSAQARQEHEGVLALRKFVRSNLTYGSSGMRDKHLELSGQRLGSITGTLHFIKFATSRMNGFFDMVTKNGLSRFSKVVCATGGGAFKFEEDFKKVCMCVCIKDSAQDCRFAQRRLLFPHFSWKARMSLQSPCLSTWV